MAAGLGFKTFTTGEVLTAADTNGYLMQGINVFASTAARDAAITSPQEGQFAFTKDTNGLWYYDGAAWVASGATGDIEGVTAGIGISGGGTSGTVTITNSMATAINAKGDLVAGTAADTFDRLAVGTNGQTLVADSSTSTGLKWAAPSTGGSAVVVAEATFTAASSVTVDNCFTSTYRNYQIVCNYTTSGGGGVRFRVRAGGSSISTATYNFQLFDSKSTTNTGDRGVADTSYVMGFGTSGSFNSSFNAMIYNPQIATPTTFFSQCSQQDGALNAPVVALSAGNQTGATAFDGFEFINGGTMTGNYTVYGLGKTI
jgi:hypothetical protein